MRVSLRHWIQAARPKTLTAAVVPILVGTALVPRAEDVRWTLSALALFSALLIQIGTNFVNDAIDFKKGADSSERVGPTRVTSSGVFSYSQVMGAAYLCLGAAFLLGIPLVIAGGWPLVAIGLLSLFFAYGYTGGPFPLAYLGLGDLFVLIFFGWVAVGGVYFLQMGSWDAPALIAGSQIGALATVLIAINNLRDREGDARVGKNTLSVRLGVRGSRTEIALLAFLPYLGGIYWVSEGNRGAAALPLLSLPLAVGLVIRIFKIAPGPAYNALLAKAAKLHLVFGVLLAMGLILNWVAR